MGAEVTNLSLAVDLRNSQNTDDLTDAENAILGCLDLPLAWTEQGLTEDALSAIERFCDEAEKEALQDWKYEVANGDTQLGFTSWLNHREQA